nr:ribonuclease H-like domain-containing protein [Tanacetum cinerariifolium]
MSTRIKLGLGFKEYIGSDEVFELSTPSVFNPEPENREENVKPPRNLCNKSGIADGIHCKNNFVRTKTCFVCGSKSHLIKDCDMYDNVDNFPSVVSKAASVPVGSRNSSASISAGRSIPTASRNRPACIHAGRHIPAGRFNKPAPFPTGRSVPTSWTNHAARLFFGPTTLYFDNVSCPRIYDYMSMNKGRWGSAVKSSAGRKPALSFMRPFGCIVTILNTIDHLGKFDGKADEGFFVGHSTNRKAFRVFKSRIRIVEENLHVKFSENTHNITGSRPNWLFDIDALTKSMNYKPVAAGNKSNGSAGTKACDIVGKTIVETVPDKDYILPPLWTLDRLLSSSSKDLPGAGYKPSEKEEKEDIEDPENEDSEVPSTKELRVNQEKDSVNNTNRVNDVSSNVNNASNEVNVVGRKSSIELPDDLNMPKLDDILAYLKTQMKMFLVNRMT